MNHPVFAGPLDCAPKPRTRGRGKPPLWSEDEIDAFIEMLRERPVLFSPELYKARSTARGRAEKLRIRLASRNVRCSVRVWCETEGPYTGQHRWAVIRQQESKP